MKKIVVSLVAAVALTGCNVKEDLSDPQKFVEHYGNELLGEHFKSDMELMAYKGFEFSNAKVGIDRNGFEYVSALVSLIVPRGENYYRRLESPSSADMLKTRPADVLSHVIGHEDSLAIGKAYREVRKGERAPVVYSSSPVDIKKIVSPWRTIRIIRLKDGEGVYRPVGDIRRAVQWYAADGDEMSEMSGIPVEPFYTGVNGLLSGEAIKRLEAVKDGTPEAIQAIESYVSRLEGIDGALARLNACCVTQAEILAVAPSYATTNATPRWIWERCQKEMPNIQALISDARNKANVRNQEAANAVRNAQSALNRLNSQVGKAERALRSAKKNLEDDLARLERLSESAAKARRPSERTNAKVEQMRERVTTSDPKAIADAETALADLNAKIQAAKSALAEAKALQVKNDEEGKSSVAKAEADGQKTLSQVMEKLEREYRDLKQKSSEELKAALDDCKRKLGI